MDTALLIVFVYCADSEKYAVSWIRGNEKKDHKLHIIGGMI